MKIRYSSYSFANVQERICLTSCNNIRTGGGRSGKRQGAPLMLLAHRMCSLKLNPAHEKKMGTSTHSHRGICLISFLSAFSMLTVPLGFISIIKHGMLSFVHAFFLRFTDLHEIYLLLKIIKTSWLQTKSWKCGNPTVLLALLLNMLNPFWVFMFQVGIH